MLFLECQRVSLGVVFCLFSGRTQLIPCLWPAHRALLSKRGLLLEGSLPHPRCCRRYIASLSISVQRQLGTLAREGASLCHSFLPVLPILSCPVLPCPLQSGPPSLQATPTPFPILHLHSPFPYLLPHLLHISTGLCFVMVDDTLPSHLGTQLCNPQHGI